MVNDMSTQLTYGMKDLLQPPLSTAILSSAIVVSWYMIDPTNLLEKIALIAFLALVREKDNWFPYLKRKVDVNLIGKRELQAWKESFDSFKNSKVAKDLGKINLNYSDWSNKQHEDGQRWDTAEEFRAPVRSAAAKVINDIFSKHIALPSKILEIGSNELDSRGCSCIARLLPKDYLDDLTYSDYIPAVVKREISKASKIKRNYIHLDLRQPNPEFFDSQNCLVAINVADVISRHDLSKIAKGAYQLLKKEGKFVILADRPIESTPLFGKFGGTDFVFPWTEDVSGNAAATLIKGAKVTSKDTIRQILNAWGEEYKLFFDQLFSLTHSQRQEFLKQSFFQGLQLCQFLQMLTENHCQSYETCKSYQNDVTLAFESNQFETVFSGYMEGSDLIDHPDPTYSKTEGLPYNKMSYDLRNGGPVKGKMIRGIERGKVQTEAIFHVMIFKKKI